MAVKGYIISALIFGILGIWVFWTVAAPPSENLPRGPIEIGVGPGSDVSLVKTELFINIESKFMKLQVTFKFNKTKKYFIYALFPYAILGGSTHVIHNSVEYGRYGDPIGNFSQNFMNTGHGFSIINATVDLNPTFPFRFAGPDPKDEITLGVRISFRSSLTSVSYPLNARQTFIATFFGDVSTIMRGEMYDYRKPTGQPTINGSFIVHVRIPQSLYFSESQPSPIRYYVGESWGRDDRWVMFSMDFLEGRYAQTLFCSFFNPAVQGWKEVGIFSSGVFAAFSGSFVVEIIKHYLETS